MAKFYFTFGCNQVHENKYHVIEAENAEAARIEMFRIFGNKWSAQYNSAKAAGVKEFGLTEIK